MKKNILLSCLITVIGIALVLPGAVKVEAAPIKLTFSIFKVYRVIIFVIDLR